MTMLTLPNDNEIIKREVLFIPVVERSCGMTQDDMVQINDAMRTLVSELADINTYAKDYEITVAPLVFSSDADWHDLLDNRPCLAQDYLWNDLCANGEVHFVPVCKHLDAKMCSVSIGGWISKPLPSVPVLLFVMKDPLEDDWQASFDNLLKRRGYFRHATKFAISLQGGQAQDILETLTGTKETVLTVKAGESLSQTVQRIINLFPFRNRQTREVIPYLCSH